MAGEWITQVDYPASCLTVSSFHWPQSTPPSSSFPIPWEPFSFYRWSAVPLQAFGRAGGCKQITASSRGHLLPQVPCPRTTFSCLGLDISYYFSGTHIEILWAICFAQCQKGKKQLIWGISCCNTLLPHFSSIPKSCIWSVQSRNYFPVWVNHSAVIYAVFSQYSALSNLKSCPSCSA